MATDLYYTEQERAILQRVENERDRAQRDERETLRAYARLFGTEDGVRVLRDMERKAYVGKTTLVRPTPTAPVDMMETAYCEGMRAAILEIKARILRGQKNEEAPRKAVSDTAEEM